MGWGSGTQKNSDSGSKSRIQKAPDSRSGSATLIRVYFSRYSNIPYLRGERLKGVHCQTRVVALLGRIHSIQQFTHLK